MTTHSPECYEWHHDCAVAEVKRLRAALAEPVQRKPLTEEEIDAIMVPLTQNRPYSWREFARAIERAHGIGVKE